MFIKLTAHPDITTYVNAMYVSFGCSFVLSVGLVIPMVHICSLQNISRELGTFFKYGFLIQTGNIAQLFNYRLSYYILDHFHAQGRALVWIFSTGVSLAEGLWLISRSISMVQYVAIANSKDDGYARSLTILLIKVSFICVGAMLLVAVVIPGSVYILVFGPEFGMVRTVILYLSVGVLAFSVSGILSHYFAGLGRYNVNTWSSVIGLVFTVAIGFMIIPTFGLLGAGLTASVSYTISTLYQLVVFLKEPDVSLTLLLPSASDMSQFKGYFVRIFR